ncbi:hypothetical protein [Ensifer sp. BR816]|uniref:hypothetical protein n=1 Tax=Rhizobium sp. (strain BR816) TaxID=1057002 RepID=UPI0003AA2F42|nr:hypothetical protein [Ensifer sp. BR816]
MSTAGARRRGVRLLFIGLLVCASGCAPLRFEGLQTATTTYPASRISHFIKGEPAPDYPLRSSDVLAFKIIGPNGTSEPIEKVEVDGADEWQSEASPVFRIPVALADGVLLSFRSKALDPSPAIFNLSLTGKTWAQVRAAANRIKKENNHALPLGVESKRQKLRFWLEPADQPDLLAVGDTVKLTRRYRVEVAFSGEDSQSHPDPYSFTQSEAFDLQVDARGRVLFPSIGKLSNPVDRPNDVAARAAFSQLEHSNGVLQLADPGLSIDRQPTLDALAVCLSQGELFDESDRSSPCWRAGVRRALAPETQDGAATISDLVYRMAPAARTWSLVDEDGRRVTIPFYYGATVPSIAEQEYEKAFGRLFYRDFARRAYIVVVPRKTISSNAEAPFYLEVRAKQTPPTAFLLHPGDTVFVTRTRPRSKESEP